jgi:SOS-response transcriptional repressor LexA
MTQLQTLVLLYVNNYIDMYSYSPSYKEIKENCTLSSNSHAHKIVKALILQGELSTVLSGVRKIRRKADGKQIA